MAERDRNNALSAINEVDDIENMYLTFDVRDEEYAISIAYVTEIVGLQKVSEVPDVPEYIKGVINLRGQVIPVMDMRLRFGLPWREYGDRTTVVVLESDDVTSTGSGQVLTGLVVDQVTDVLSIAPEDIAPPPRWQGADERERTVIKGLGRREDGVSIILDVPRLLSARDVRLSIPSEADGGDERVGALVAAEAAEAVEGDDVARRE
jgi:purine-binding chemotaxis protein CheW